MISFNHTNTRGVGKMNNPKCPICNSDMVKRLAKKGPNAGNYFWSCENYFKTGCKGTRDFIEENEASSRKQFKEKNEEQVDQINHIIPELFRSKSLYRGFDSIFVQSISIPYELLTLINKEEVKAQNVRSFSQWRMDFKLNDLDYIEPIVNEVFTLVLKLLTRGTLTISSEVLERKVKKIFKFDSFKENLDAYLIHKKKSNSRKIDFDVSHYEEELYYVSLERILDRKSVV